jgi:hypothetical protein
MGKESRWKRRVDGKGEIGKESSWKRRDRKGE